MTNQTDTKQQQIALRTNAAARRVRATFPAGTRVEGTTDRGETGTGAFGTVVRHNAGTDALGGTLRIKWDNGAEGRSVPTAVRKVTTCTVTQGIDPATGEFRRCGKPAVRTFTGHHGETFAECAEHAPRHAGRPGISAPGTVEVHRQGRVYIGRVTRVTRYGTVYAEITYDNGVTREVRVDR